MPKRYARTANAKVCRSKDCNAHPRVNVTARNRVWGFPLLGKECRQPFVELFGFFP